MKRLSYLIGLLIMACVVWALALAASSQASATFTVNSTADTDDGTCDSSNCTLREAINAANSATGADEILFSVSGTITLSTSLPSITDTAGLTLSGPADGIAVSGNHTVAVFHVAPNAAFTLQSLTISDGQAGIGSGGAIQNQGALTVTHCAFLRNHANAGGAVHSDDGGSMLISSSTFFSNTAATGGAIRNGMSTTAIANSTFVSNTADYGGAITNASGWSVNLLNSTFSGNGAASSGVLHNGSGAIRVRNTIVANSSVGANCSGTITNQGNNIDSGSTCGWASTNGSMSNTDPKLGALADNGGETETMALLPGSPAIDGVTYNAPNLCPPTDQRDVERPIDGDRDGTARCDIGAYEKTIDVYLPLVMRNS